MIFFFFFHLYVLLICSLFACMQGTFSVQGLTGVVGELGITGFLEMTTGERGVGSYFLVTWGYGDDVDFS